MSNACAGEKDPLTLHQDSVGLADHLASPAGIVGSRKRCTLTTASTVRVWEGSACADRCA